ncbi:hypothetical protein M9458_039334, partial [Cirrhinus mrigala]
FNIKLWKTFTDRFNCLPIGGIIIENVMEVCFHHTGSRTPLWFELSDTGADGELVLLRSACGSTVTAHVCCVSGLLCDLLLSDPDKDVQGSGENDRGASFTFGADVVSKVLNRHDPKPTLRHTTSNLT